MKPRLLRTLTGALVTAVAAGCSSKAAGNPADSATVSRPTAFALNPAQRERLHIVTAQRTTFRPTIEVTGTVAFNGDRSTQVLAPISGPALRILTEPGAEVHRGQIMATVTSPDFAADVAQYRKAVSAYQNLRRIADQNEELWKNDAIAKRDLDQSETDAASAQADREAALEQLRALGVDESQIQAIREGKVMTQPLEAAIRAPIDGTVVEKLIADGQLLQAGTTACFTIADLSSMWVMANVFPSDLHDVSVGEVATVTTQASPTPLQGRVDYVASLVDPSSNATGVRVVVPNVGRALRRDMFVTVDIQSTHEHNGILVPTASLLRDLDNLPYVYVQQPDNSFARRRVTIGYRMANQYEITGGLNNGDRVVADGALFIQFAESQ